MLSDREMQENETLVLESIFSTKEFKCVKKRKNLECLFMISCSIASNNLMVGVEKLHPQYFSIKHLPPIRLYVQLPANYPSSSPPEYSLSVNWLPPWNVSLLCQKLDELWQANEHSEILFIWQQFLKDDLQSYLNLNDSLDLSYLYDLFIDPSDPFLSIELLKDLCDSRVLYGGLDLNPIEKLLDYNRQEDLVEFEASIQVCSICFLQAAGKMFVKLQLCSHAFCKDCIILLLTTKIEERRVRIIKCPEVDCNATITHNQIQEICAPELFQRYEECLLTLTLLNKYNLVYCPRKICMTPVTVESGESLASCSQCDYNFCAFCLKVYHGVNPCHMDDESKTKLIETYAEGDNCTKKLLEKKYGKNQIRQIVEKHLTHKYLKENTRICPVCGAATIKISGCNLMTCSHCDAHFCWLCNSKIASEDKYEHFKSSDLSSCAGRLFEGIVLYDEYNEEDDIDILQNLELAMIYE